MTSVTRGYDRVSIHGVRRTLLKAQADALRLPLVEMAIDPQCSNDAYEAAFKDTLRTIKRDWPAVSCIAFGDLFLEDVRAYRERLLEGTGFEPLFPLWGLNTTELARDVVAGGYVARLVCVDTTQLDSRFAGRLFDTALLEDLPSTVDPCGERGEFHTFVSDGPSFQYAVAYAVGEKVLRDGRFMYCDLA